MNTRYLFLILSCLFTSCIAVKYHDYASIDQDIAVETINKLKSDTLLIVIPTFRHKEALLTTISKKRNTKRQENRQRLLNLHAERQIQQLALMYSFIENYEFSEYLFIPDSLVTAFESGIAGNYFLNNNGEIDPLIQYSNTRPIKLIQQFDQEWQIKVGNKIIPNPFPNYYIYRNGLYGFLGEETYAAMYDRVAIAFQKRFDQFYANPDRRVYL